MALTFGQILLVYKTNQVQTLLEARLDNGSHSDRGSGQSLAPRAVQGGKEEAPGREPVPTTCPLHRGPWVLLSLSLPLLFSHHSHPPTHRPKPCGS